MFEFLIALSGGLGVIAAATGFLTHDRAVENAVYDLLMNFKPHN